MPKGFYTRSKKYKKDMSIRIKEVMNRPAIKAHQKKMALKRRERERSLSVEETIEPKKVIEEEPKKAIEPEDEAMEIATEFINGMENKDHARIILKSLESVNNKEEAVKKVGDDYDKFPTDRLRIMAEELEREFQLAGLCDICREAFYLSLRAERSEGKRAKYLVMLKELGKSREKLEKAKRKRGR